MINKTENSSIYAILKEGGDNERAEEMSRNLLQKLSSIKSFNSRHSEAVVLAQHNLAVSLAQQGKNEEALEILDKSSKEMERIYGESHSVTKRSYWWIEKLNKLV